MSLKNKIPNIPELNFEHDKQGNILFESSGGIIRLNDLRMEIKNKIKVVVSDIISVDFDFTSTIYELDLDYNSELIFEYKDYEIILSKFIQGTMHNSHRTLKFKHLSLNNGSFEQDENVNVWNLIEDFTFLQKRVLKFKSPNIEDLNLLCENTINYSIKDLHHEVCKNKGLCENSKLKYMKFCEDSGKKINNIITKQENELQKSLNQFKNVSGYFHYFDKYEKIESKWKDIFYNLTRLLSVYYAVNFKFNIKIIKGENNNLQCELETHESNISNNTLFYEKYEQNLFNFLDSTYENFEKDENLDRICYFYPLTKQTNAAESQFALESVFLEVFIKQYLNVKEIDFNSGLKCSLSKLNISYLNVLKFFVSDLNNHFLSLENKYLILNLKYNKNFFICANDLLITFNGLKKELIFRIITKYRNRIIHEGKLCQDGDFNKFLKGSKNMLSNNNPDLTSNIEAYYNFICIESKDFDLQIKHQLFIFEGLTDLIILTILKPQIVFLKSQYYYSNNEEFECFSQDYIKNFKNIQKVNR